MEPQAHSVFVSYRRLDDEPPPEAPKDCGFVRYLSKQLRWELRMLGVPETIFWRDRAEIDPGDAWSDTIREALSNADLFLAILSRNYIRSSWCNQELSTMASRIELLDSQAGRRRIFRVDKHSVPDEQIPEPLRRIQSVRFYTEDDETKHDCEYFWRGEVRRKDEYMEAVHRLALAIYERLAQLGISTPPLALPREEPLTPRNGHIIFVAKPASDMGEAYRTLVRELRRTGYEVTPDADQDLPKDGDEARTAIVNALTKAEASVHFLGERTGGRPCGLDVDLVPLQLACAALESQKKLGFERLIWAPKVPPRRASDEVEVAPRDPLSVLDRFDHRLSSDQIDGDTASRFNEFVLQRLGKLQVLAPETGSIYIRCASHDRNFGLSVARELKRNGLGPMLNPAPTDGTPQELAQAEQRLLSRAKHVVICWGLQSPAQILVEVTDPILQKWRSRGRREHKLTLILSPPTCEPKVEVAEFGFGLEVDCVVDATRGENLALAIEGQLVPALKRP